ncbi:MAG: hypothetical protein HOI95_06655, partial [Chromatiales bacterium]|nr:hypothetical protein [Chromatiales bacterium]
DRMLDMGFIHDIKRVLAKIPKERQNLLFSATFLNEIRSLANRLMDNPQVIDVAPRNSAAVSVRQTHYAAEKKVKPQLLAELIHGGGWSQVLVFTRTKHGANKLVQKLQHADLTAAAIHGNKSQSARVRALTDFKEARIRVLVATDIAARGLDINALPHVVNFELPNVAEDYVHRIGRTGRAGAEGDAVSLVAEDERPFLRAIERLIGRKIERKVLTGFTPSETVEPEAPKVVHRDPQNATPRQPNKHRRNRRPVSRAA